MGSGVKDLITLATLNSGFVSGFGITQTDYSTILGYTMRLHMDGSLSAL
jgi:hypothetical protein